MQHLFSVDTTKIKDNVFTHVFFPHYFLQTQTMDWARIVTGLLYISPSFMFIPYMVDHILYNVSFKGKVHVW